MYSSSATYGAWRCLVSRAVRFVVSVLALLGGIGTLEAQDTSPPPKAFPAAPEHDLVVRVCSGCHVPEMVTAKRHTAEEWDDIIARMVDHGAKADEAQQDQVLAYLVRFYGKPAGN